MGMRVRIDRAISRYRYWRQMAILVVPYSVSSKTRDGNVAWRSDEYLHPSRWSNGHLNAKWVVAIIDASHFRVQNDIELIFITSMGKE